MKMNKMIQMGLVALVVSFVLVCGVMTQEASGVPGVLPGEVLGNPAHWGELEKISGTVERIDRAKKEIVLQTEEGEMTIFTDKETITSAWARKLPFARVKKGMWAIIEYVKEGDKPIARWINVAKTKDEMEKRMEIR
jgi:hypothetical protein